MPRYRLHAPSYLSVSGRPEDARVYQPGAEIDYKGVPGSKMEPLDDKAWTAFHAHFGNRPNLKHPFAVKPVAIKPPAPPVHPSDVDIPEDWREIKGLPLLHLARKLGKTGKFGREDAVQFIEAEVARRAAV
jgi:hypothetical protein